MTVVLRDVPGLTLRELIEAAQDVAGPDVPIETGYGGIVVPERLAFGILRAYLTATGAVPQRAPVAAPVTRQTEAEPEQPPPAAKKPTRAGRTTRKKAGEP